MSRRPSLYLCCALVAVFAACTTAGPVRVEGPTGDVVPLLPGGESLFSGPLPGFGDVNARVNLVGDSTEVEVVGDRGRTRATISAARVAYADSEFRFNYGCGVAGCNQEPIPDAVVEIWEPLPSVYLTDIMRDEYVTAALRAAAANASVRRALDMWIFALDDASAQANDPNLLANRKERADAPAAAAPVVGATPPECKGDERKLFSGTVGEGNLDFSPYPVAANLTVARLSGESRCFTEPADCVGAPNAGAPGNSITLTEGPCQERVRQIGADGKITMTFREKQGFVGKLFTIDGRVTATQGKYCRVGAEDEFRGLSLTINIGNLRPVDIKGAFGLGQLTTTGEAAINIYGYACSTQNVVQKDTTAWAADALNKACYQPDCK